MSETVLIADQSQSFQLGSTAVIIKLTGDQTNGRVSLVEHTVAPLTRRSICSSMLRDTYAIRFVRAGFRLVALREQLGVAGLASVKRYQHFCERQKEERWAQVCPEVSMSIRQS